MMDLEAIKQLPHDEKVLIANRLLKQAADIMDWNVYGLGDQIAVKAFVMTEGLIKELPDSFKHPDNNITRIERLRIRASNI